MHDPLTGGAGLVFAGGCPRSGLAVLRRILTADPRIHCGSDTGLAAGLAQQWANFADQLGELHAASFGLGMADVRRHMGSLIADLLGSPLRTSPGHRVVEKTSLNIITFDRLAVMLPEARFIHLVRDGADTAHSLLARNWTGPDGRPLPHVSDAPTALAYWSRLAEIGLAAEATIGPERCLRLRYERLVRDPAASLMQIQRFLGLEPRRVRDFSHAISWRELERESLPALDEAINGRFIGQGRALRARMTPAQLALQQHIRKSGPRHRPRR